MSDFDLTIKMLEDRLRCDEDHHRSLVERHKNAARQELELRKWRKDGEIEIAKLQQELSDIKRMEIAMALIPEAPSKKASRL